VGSNTGTSLAIRREMTVLRLLIVVLCACGQGSAGAPCARHSDCASGVCRPNGTCSDATDAGVVPEPDAYTTKVPDYIPDAAVDAD
jgi:hypothetical protein